MKYVTKKRVFRFVGGIATLIAVLLLSSCFGNSTPPCNVDNKSIDCDASRSSTSVVPSSSVKPTTSVSRTPSTTTTTSTTVPTTTSSTTSAAPDTISVIDLPDRYIIIHSDGRPNETEMKATPVTTAPPATVPPPVLAPTTQQPVAPAPASTVERRAITPHDQQGRVEGDAATGTGLYVGSTLGSEVGGASLKSAANSDNGLSELTFTSTPSGPAWRYIVVRRSVDPEHTGVRFDIPAKADINAGAGLTIKYDFGGYDDIETIYFVY